MKQATRRTPKYYDGPRVTTHHLDALAAAVLRDVAACLQERPDLVLAAWPGVIGPSVASMTEAVSFTAGVLLVRVKNSTLFSLLSQREKPKILLTLRRKLPKTTIYDIVFRMS